MDGAMIEGGGQGVHATTFAYLHAENVLVAYLPAPLATDSFWAFR